MAIGLFLVENGCDLAVKNKNGKTASDVMISLSCQADLVEMFKQEGYRYSMMSKLRFISNPELKDVVVSFKNERHSIDSESRPFCESTTPTKDVNSSCRTCNDMQIDNNIYAEGTEPVTDDVGNIKRLI